MVAPPTVATIVLLLISASVPTTAVAVIAAILVVLWVLTLPGLSARMSASGGRELEKIASTIATDVAETRSSPWGFSGLAMMPSLLLDGCGRGCQDNGAVLTGDASSVIRGDGHGVAVTGLKPLVGCLGLGNAAGLAVDLARPGDLDGCLGGVGPRPADDTAGRTGADHVAAAYRGNVPRGRGGSTRGGCRNQRDRRGTGRRLAVFAGRSADKLRLRSREGFALEVRSQSGTDIGPVIG